MKKIVIDDINYELVENINDGFDEEKLKELFTDYFYEYDYSFESQIGHMLLSIFGLAKHMNIDLIWHVEQKMRYNELRGNKHGKRY